MASFLLTDNWAGGKHEENNADMTLDPQCRVMLNAMEEKGSPFDADDTVEARRIIAVTPPSYVAACITVSFAGGLVLRA